MHGKMREPSEGLEQDKDTSPHGLQSSFGCYGRTGLKQSWLRSRANIQSPPITSVRCGSSWDEGFRGAEKYTLGELKDERCPT